MHILTTLVVAMLWAAPTTARAQGHGCEMLLRDGSVLEGKQLRRVGADFVVTLATGERAVAGKEVVALFAGATTVVALPACHLHGGDVVFGAVAGGDAAGNELQLQSPVFGRMPIAVDRLLTLASPGAESQKAMQLPAGVDEAMFVRAAFGWDIVAGTVHQFGAEGVRFQPDGAPLPRWYRSEEFLALRLRSEGATAFAPEAWLTTRLGDRLATSVQGLDASGLQCTVLGSVAVKVPFADLASLTFAGDWLQLSDLVPSKVEETGFDGEVVHSWQVDRNVVGGALVSGGRSYGKGLGMHSKCRLTFVVPEGVDRFWTRVAFDDSVAGLRLAPKADVRVLVDGKVVFEQRDLTVGQLPQATGMLPVRAGGTLVLEVDHGRGRDLGDRINWLSPVFLPAMRRP